MLGLDKQNWQAVHINIALLCLIVAMLHLFLNWNLFWSYIKKAGGFGLNMKVEILLAAILAAAVFAGTIYQVPPFSMITSFNYEIKDYWDKQAGEELGREPGGGPGFGRGFGQGGGNRMDGFGPGQGQGRQGRGGGRGGENRDN